MLRRSAGAAGLIRRRASSRRDAQLSYMALSAFFRGQIRAQRMSSTQPLGKAWIEHRGLVRPRSGLSNYLEPSNNLPGSSSSFSTKARLAAEDGSAKIGGAGSIEGKTDKPQTPDASTIRGNAPPQTPRPLPASSEHDTAHAHPTKHPKPEVIAHVSSFPKSLRDLALSLPSSGFRRPTKDELLSATSNFFDRLRIRFKWFTIRGFRRFRADDWSAFLSWLIGGMGIWIILGTTSFFSAVFLILKPLQLQEWIATSLGSYLTSQSGVTVVFESAIVPKFSARDSKLIFKNVYLSRGMDDAITPATAAADAVGAGAGQVAHSARKQRFRRASGETLADLRHRDAIKTQELRSSQVNPALPPPSPPPGDDEGPTLVSAEDSAPQYTHFHLAVDSIEVSLSLPRWLDGKGLVKEAVVRGVRGIIDRSHMQHKAPTGDEDHRRFRHQAHPGDFHLENFAVEDFLVTVYQPDNFRPYIFSIFSAHIPNLRKQWLLFDLLSAESITGQIDNCLFSLHRPQSIGRTSEEDYRDTAWKRMSRFRIDGVPIDHLQSSQDSGPLSWINSGRADLVADIRFPREPDDDVDINTILGDIVDNLDEALRSSSPSNREPQSARIPGRPELAKGKPLEAPKTTLRSMLGIDEDNSHRDDTRLVSFDLDIRFKDVKATVPLFNSDLSHVSNALVRPIVAFINSNKTLIPVKCHLDIGLEEFDGSWTAYDIGLLDAVSEQVYSALAHHVQTSQAKRAKAVGIWSLQKSAAAILMAFKQNVEHAS